MCTQAQYMKLDLTNPSEFKTDDEPDLAMFRPVNKVSWDTLRGQKYSAKLDLGEDAAGPSFLKRLNARTKQASGITAFDLPGEVMFEIATRAGVSNTKYYWGDEPDDKFRYAFATKSWDTVGIQNGFSWKRPYMVGSYQPNKWGFYDMSGLSWEWMRDDNSLGNLGDAAGPFAFAWDGTRTEARARGGAIYDANMTDNEFRASHRNKTAMNNSSRQHHGFRIAWIRQ
jgi:formylglycine-generating enzyme required for sulfatase activity